MTDAQQILQAAKSILVVDWPSNDVPDTLASAGYAVSVKGGPEVDNYNAYEIDGGQVIRRRLGHAPDRVDIVYCHRPIDELPGIVALAQELGATTIWLQSGRAGKDEKDPKGCWMPEDDTRKASELVESAGLRYIADVYIADAVRALAVRK